MVCHVRLKRKIFIAFSLLILCALSVQSEVRVANLYQTEVEVEDQSPSLRIEAMKKGLLIVLKRVSGSQKIENEEAIKESLGNPAIYRRSSRYKTIESKGASQLVIVIRFNPTQINRLLAKADLPIWGDKRPTTLIWIGIEDGRNRYILGSEQSNATTKLFKDEIKKIAGQRGIPILFPIMDLEDQQKIRYTDISGGFLDPVKKASKRYSTDAILLGKIRRRGSNLWKARWTLIIQGKSHFFETELSDLSVSSAAGVHGLANYLASNISESSPMVQYDDDASLKLAVSNINNMADYATVLKNIKKLKSVKQLQVIYVSESKILFSIELKSDLNRFKQAISNDPKLKVEEDEDASPLIESDKDSAGDQNNNSSRSNLQNNAGMLNYRYTP